MAPSVPTAIPEQWTAGQTWKVRLSYADFPAADGWSLALHLRGAKTLDATVGNDRVSVDGSEFVVTIPAADTAAITAGVYEWVVTATLDGEVYEADAGHLTVLPDLATAEEGDRQTHAERMVALLESEIEARITGTGSAHSDYMIGNRRLVKVALSELRTMLAHYRSEVARLQHGGWPPSIEVHLGRAR